MGADKEEGDAVWTDLCIHVGSGFADSGFKA